LSTTRRQQHQQLVLRQRLRTDLARNLQCLRDTGRGPTVPGPWWPVGHERWRSVEGTVEETVEAWREEDGDQS
jgi:hypothetical protein